MDKEIMFDILRATAFDNDNPTIVDGDELTAYAPDIGAMLDYWDKTDDIVEGYDAVKNAGEKYLPKFADETNADYDVRKEFTRFTNVYRDIVEGLASKPFEEEIALTKSDADTKPPAEIEDFIENVDGSGNNLTIFGSQIFFNGINSAIDWIFIDYPKVDRGVVRTLADQKRAGIRPFWSRVIGRNVRQVKTVIVGGKRELSYIRIFEPGISQPDRVRIFERPEGGGAIQWSLYEKMDANAPAERAQFQLIDEGVLSIDQIPMVPFITGRRDGSTWKFFPAMRDAADLQIKLYQSESALEFVTMLAGYPMLAANGLKPPKDANGNIKKVAVGPSKILWSEPNGQGNHGEWKYLEPSAQTMEFQQKRIDATKQDLRELGRQPLTATSGNLTVITTAVAAGKARSAVSAWALALKDTLENALLITAKYLAVATYEPEVYVFTEFDNFVEGSEDIAALRAARDGGDLSQETYWNELKRRKVLAPEFNSDLERERLLKEIPSDGEIDDGNPDDNANLAA